MISGKTSSRLNEVADNIGRLIVGENNLLDFDGKVYKYRIGGIIYTTDLEGNTTFIYVVPNRKKENLKFTGNEVDYSFMVETNNVFFRNPNFSAFDKFLNLELLEDNDIDSYPEGFF